MADTGKTIGLIKALASVDPEAIKSSVDDWLDDHPEATTTVEDGAITKAKLDSSLQQTVDDVGDLKSVINKIPFTKSGTEIEFSASAGLVAGLEVAFEWSQGDTSNISPTNPVQITTMDECTITVNDDEYTQGFTAAGAVGVGKGTWNAVTGALSVSQKAVLVTADMVTSIAATSTSGQYAAKLNLGVTIDTTAQNNGILACSHYKIGQNPGIWMRNGTLYLYRFDTDDLETVKSYVSGLNMVVIVAISTAESYSLTGESITLASGDNTVSVDHGSMTLTYNVDAKQYIDDADAEIEEKANTADTTASAAKTQADANSAEIGVLQENIYKFETQNLSYTGTGSASGSSTIAWGAYVKMDTDVEKCWQMTLTPQFSNNTGTYTATRWKNASGNAISNGETLTKVGNPITKNKGESVSFYNVGVGEFISIEPSAGSCQRDSHAPDRMGYVNPQTGVFTSFSGSLSGAYTIITFKPIIDDSMILFGKNITLVGDSITEKNGRANINHGMWLEKWTGCNIQNLGVGGTGFARTPGSTNYKTRLSRIDPDADIIGVAASFNDMTYTLGTPSDTASDNTICGYANEFFDALLELYPTKRIACYSEGPWYNYHPGITASDNYMSAMKTICENKGIVWDDGLYRGCALRPWIQANCEVYYKGESGSYTDVVDNIHPNSAGQKVIARYLERLFEKMVD